MSFTRYNMIPFIRVFDSEHAAHLITAFENKGFIVHYDAYHRNDKSWFKTQLKCPHRLYTLCQGLLKPWQITDDWNDPPSFFIAFDDCMLVNDTDWYAITQWCVHVIFNQDVQLMYLDRVNALLDKPDKLQSTTSHKVPEKVIVPAIRRPGHSFRYELLKENDTCVYEVIRDEFYDDGDYTKFKPFVVTVFPWSVRGHKYFFTDIYGSNDWDMNVRECAGDFLFLQRLWKDLGLDGHFSNEMVKERCDRCYQGLEQEPIIYRKSLEEVISTLTTTSFGKKYAGVSNGENQTQKPSRKADSTEEEVHGKRVSR